MTRPGGWSDPAGGFPVGVHVVGGLDALWWKHLDQSAQNRRENDHPLLFLPWGSAAAAPVPLPVDSHGRRADWGLATDAGGDLR